MAFDQTLLKYYICAIMGLSLGFVYAADRTCQELLFDAVREENLEVVEFLLKKHAEPCWEYVDERKVAYTPLHYAARNGHSKIVEILLQYKAAVDQQFKDGWTPLHKAAYKGHFEIVNILLEYKAKVNYQTTDGCTPLLKAVYNGHFQIVQELLQNNAVVNPKDKHGKYIMDLALQHYGSITETNFQTILQQIFKIDLSKDLKEFIKDHKWDDVQRVLSSVINNSFTFTFSPQQFSSIGFETSHKKILKAPQKLKLNFLTKEIIDEESSTSSDCKKMNAITERILSDTPPFFYYSTKPKKMQNSVPSKKQNY